MYICPTCDYLEKTGGRPWIKKGDKQYIYSFEKHEDYLAHYERENELAPEFKYLQDKEGKTHVSCMLASQVDHDCPAHKTEQ